MTHTHDDHHAHDHRHEHDHAHKDERGLLARLGHWLSDLGGGHSHDVAEQIDDAVESDAQGRRALYISFAGLAATAVIQAVVVVL